MCSLRSSRYASMMRILLQRDPVVAMSFRASARVLAGRNVRSPVGDPKLLPAMTFFIGHHHLFPSLFFMTFCGGTLPLAIIEREMFRLQRLISLRAVVLPSRQRQREVPLLRTN